jgi:multiple sugar transport system substrate-binding protein
MHQFNPARHPVALTIGAILLAASGLGAAPTQAQHAASGTTISVVESRTYLFDSSALADRWWAGIKKEFEAKNPGVTLNVIAEPGLDIDEVNKINLMLRSQSTTPDVLSIPDWAVGGIAASSYLEPLNSYVATWDKWKQISPAVQQQHAFNGKIWAINGGNNDQGLLYNIPMFKKAGIPVPWKPHNWADILAAAMKIKALNLPKVAPLWLWAGNENGSVVCLQGGCNLLVGAKQPAILDKKTNKWVVRSSGLTDLFAFYHNVAANGLNAPTSRLFLNNALGSLPNVWMEHQEIAMGIFSNWIPGAWLKFLSGSADWLPGKTTYAATAIPTEFGQAPGVATALGGWTFAMTSGSHHKDLAWKLIQVLEERNNIINMGNWAGLVPPATQDGFSPAYVNFLPPYNAVYNSFLKYGTPLPTTGGAWNKWVHAMNDTTGQLAQNPSMTAKQAADAFANEASQLIGSGEVETLP